MALSEVLRGSLDGFTLSLILALSVAALFWRLFALRLDPREPAALKPDVPVIGHIIGMLKESHRYWAILYKQNPMPACTLPMLNGKMYIINSPELVSAAFKARTLSFDPYLIKTLKHMIPISNKAMDMFAKDDFFHPWVNIVYSKMTGTDLLKMNVNALTDIYNNINNLPQNMEIEDTFIWWRHLLTVATITTLLGRDNPWKKDRSMVAKFWEYETSVHHFVVGPAPRVTAPAAYRARAEMHKALMQCNFETRGYEAPDTSGMIKTTSKVEEEHGWSTSDKAAMAIGILQGSVNNTVPISYWYFMHIVSNPKLVKKLRVEAERLVTAGKTLPNGKREMLVDIRGLEERAPLLVAAFRENQRVVGVGVINRWVLDDTVLSDGQRSYLLKKDTPLLMSSMVNHTLEAHWGASVDEFDAERFLRTDPRTGAEREFHGDAPVPRGAFIPFGGGKHLCPGRSFASAENWGTMIAFLLGFDITTPQGTPLVVPERTMPLPTHGTGRPVAGSDLSSSFRRRKGWENVVWKVAEL
ncbi:uncharacterized protein JN550_004640 [Neoarthrinium moseri]|uniref:uncharacterized protein n=1 Tax=Neoarthrinium moseri TaxID=1658444 RepID=UPI001FDDF869|nr:uncharacterized protein JN550_004640 [Neoarthrinium moseri]KAI1871195.1 hypothetical protein JN550_004640 [Neoarthrinium moseri]